MSKLSVITPTILRPSLKLCCESVNTQTSGNWEHIVVLDRFVDTSEQKRLIDSIVHPNRSVLYCNQPRNNFGNSPRHEAWKHATGDYVLYLDCDNFLAHDRVVHDIECCLRSAQKPDWAIFPILRFGQVFCNLPPGNCATDTANMVIKREFAQWPDGPEYTMDGLFCEHLKKEHVYAAFPGFTPIVIMEKASHGL